MTFQVTDLLALISGPDNVGDNWRILRPFHRLGQAGIGVRWVGLDAADDAYIPTDPEQTVLIVRLLTGSDYCTIDRWLEERRPKVKAIVYEMDDPAWGDPMVDHLRDARFMQGKSEAELRHQGDVARYLASRCDGLITSSEPLSALVRADIPGQHVVTLPNAVDIRWFRAQMAHRAPWAREGRVTIGWLGGHRPEADLAEMARAWGRISRRYPHVRFVVAAPVIPDVLYREIEDDSVIFRHAWTPWPDVPVLYQTDIGCVSVADSPFSRCKTPIKAWEYTVGGAAVVGTPTLYGSCLAYGLVDPVETAEEWEDSLAYLVEHADFRRAQQEALMAHVERHHSLDGNLQKWVRAYSEIVEAREVVTA